MMNLRRGPSDASAVARSMVVDPIPPPTSRMVLPLGRECQSNPIILMSANIPQLYEFKVEITV